MRRRLSGTQFGKPVSNVIRGNSGVAGDPDEKGRDEGFE